MGHENLGAGLTGAANESKSTQGSGLPAQAAIVHPGGGSPSTDGLSGASGLRDGSSGADFTPESLRADGQAQRRARQQERRPELIEALGYDPSDAGARAQRRAQRAQRAQADAPKGWAPGNDGFKDGRETFSMGKGRLMNAKRFDDDGRDEHQLGAKDGLLTGADGAPMDTTQAEPSLMSPGAKKGGQNLFALDYDDERGASMYAADSMAECGERSAVGHESFLQGKPVGAAGEIAAKQGWAQMVSNASNEYVLGTKSNLQAVEGLDRMGVNTDATIVHNVERDHGSDVHDYFNARAFRASGGDVDLLKTHKQMFSGIHDRSQTLRDTSRDELGGETAGTQRAATLRKEATASQEPRPFPEKDQEKTGQSRLDDAAASPIDARGEAMTGFAAGKPSDNRLREQADKAAADKAAAEKAAADKAAADKAAADKAAADKAAADKAAADKAAADKAAAANTPAEPEPELEPWAGDDGSDESYESDEDDDNPYNLPDEVRFPERFQEKPLAGDRADDPAADAAVDSPSPDEAEVYGPRQWRAGPQRGGPAKPRPGELALDRVKPSPNVKWAKYGTRRWDETESDRVRDAKPPTEFRADSPKHMNENQKYFSRTPGLPDSVKERTAYFDEKQRDAHEIHAEDGRLMRADGEAMDTSAGKAPLNTGKDGRNIFGLDADGLNGQRLFAADAMAETNESLAGARAAAARGESATADHTHHTSFASGQRLHGAGDIEAKQGWLKTVTNESGHYLPGLDSNLQTVRKLDKMGVNIDAAKVENVWQDPGKPVESEAFQALAVLNSENNPKVMKSHLDFFEKLEPGNAGKLKDAGARPESKRAGGPRSEEFKDWWRDKEVDSTQSG